MVKFNLIAAVCENMGIGINNNLPWKLKKEMEYFSKMTSLTDDQNVKNVVLMGRRTWNSIPPKYKPLSNRINFILSHSDIDLSNYEDCYNFKSLEDAINKLNNDNFRQQYENVWVIGGSHVYEETMNSKYFHRLYLTRIKKYYKCDTFFPKLDENLKKISDSKVPEEIQEENGVQFVYEIYEKPNNL